VHSHACHVHVLTTVGGASQSCLIQEPLVDTCMEAVIPTSTRPLLLLHQRGYVQEPLPLLR
jgi:hypothetical protein